MDPTQINAEGRNVLMMEGEALLACAQRLAKDPFKTQFYEAVQALKTAMDNDGKVIVTGLGKSGKVAQKIAATLSSTGCLAVFLHPTEGLHGDLGIVGARDVVLALSYSGNTEELIHLLDSLKELGVKIIGLGGNAQSQLASASDYWLDAKIEQEACPHNLAPTTSTTLALALGDALAVTLMKERGINEKSFARNHPGGAIGKRLNLKVSDLMHDQSQVGTVRASDGIENIVDTLTEKRLGGILVVEGEKLLGLITEGDIRRAVRKKDQFFELKASDLMTASPITIEISAPATEALSLMEKRDGQISVLPVVDAKGTWQGLLRLHDIVQNL